MKKVICIVDHYENINNGDIFDVLDDSRYYWYIASTEGGKPFWASKDSFKIYAHPSFLITAPFIYS